MLLAVVCSMEPTTSLSSNLQSNLATTEPPFAFGENWRSFLSVLTEERIDSAQLTLQTLLRRDSLNGTRFLDVGSGSGLFSLAAYRLGAEVFSFDQDHHSVACTQELRRRYGNAEDRWA